MVFLLRSRGGCGRRFDVLGRVDGDGVRLDDELVGAGRRIWGLSDLERVGLLVDEVGGGVGGIGHGGGLWEGFV